MSTDSRAPVTPQLVAGVFITLLGVVLILDRLELVESRHLRPFWPLVLVALGLAMLLQRRDPSGRFWGAAWITIGTWMLLNAFGWIDVTIWQLIGPLLLILIGGTVLAHALRRQQPPAEQASWPMVPALPERERPLPPPLQAPGAAPGPHRAALSEAPASSEPDGMVSLFAVLGEAKRTSNDNPFRGGEMTAFLGGCVLDLRQASIPPGQHVVINVLAVMAGHEIRVPPGWVVASDIVPLLGGVDDKRLPALEPLPPDAPRLRLRGIVLMGGVVLKA
jgi:hypothetical protein